MLDVGLCSHQLPPMPLTAARAVAASSAPVYASARNSRVWPGPLRPFSAPVCARPASPPCWVRPLAFAYSAACFSLLPASPTRPLPSDPNTTPVNHA